MIFEQWLKNKLGGTSTHREVDAEALWEKVAADLPGEPLPPAASTSMGNATYVVGLLMVLLFVGSIYRLSSTVPESTHPTTERISKNTPKVNLAYDAPTNVDPTIMEEKVSASPPRKRVAGEPIDGEVPRYRNSIATQRTNPAGNPTQQRAQQPLFLQEQAPASTITVASNSVVSPLQRMPIALLTDNAVDIPIAQDTELAASRRRRFGLSVALGSHVSMPTYAGRADDGLGDLLSAADGQLLGYSAQVEASYRVAPGLQVSAGVGVSGTASAFRHQSRYDTTTTVDGALVDAVAIRTVSHTNRRQVLFVPVSVVYGRAIGKFDLQLGVGCALNFVTSQHGRTLNAAREIITYGINSPEPPIKRVYVGYHFRPMLTYWASPRLGVQFRPELRYQQFGRSPLWEVNGYSVDVGASFGLNFAL